MHLDTAAAGANESILAIVPHDPSLKKTHPGKLPPAKQSIACRNVLKALKDASSRQQIDGLREPIIVDVDSSNLNYAVGYSPCLTRTRAMNGGHWATHVQRRLNTREMLMLMGVQPSRVQRWHLVMSERQFRGVIGNAVCVPVLRRILERLFHAVGLDA